MAGLLDFLNSAEAQTGLGLLAAAGPRSDGAGFGQRMLEGLSQGERWKAQQAAQKRAEMQDQLQQMQMAQAQRQIAMEQAAMEQAARKRAALPGLFQAPSAGAPALSADSLLPPEFRAGLPPQAAVSPRQGGIDVQKALAADYSVKEIQELDALRNIGLNKVARTMKGMQNGREVDQQFDDYGRPVGQGFEQFKAPIMLDRGGQVDAISPYTQPGQSFAKTMTFGDRNAAANLSIAQQRLDLDREKFGMEKSGGSAKTTEGEKTAGALLQRLRSSQLQMEDALAGGKTGAEKPGLIAQGMRGMGAETLANTVTSSERQRVEAAQMDILDAALTLGTGAAYTKEQLEGYRKSYFPQIGDGAATIQDKQDRLRNILSAAEIKAGGAAKSVPSVADMKASRMRPKAPAGSLGSGSFQIISVEQ